MPNDCDIECCPDCACECPDSTAPAPDPAPEDPDTPEYPEFDYLKVGSYNVWHRTLSKNWEAVRDTLLTALDEWGYHVIGLQECGPGNMLKVAEALEAEGHTVIAPRGGGKQSCPIVVNKTLNVRASSEHQLTGRIWVGPGAGPSRLVPKYLHRVHFHFNGRHFNVFNMHGIASTSRFRLRYRKGKRMFENACEIMESRGGLRIVTADWNTKPDGDLVAMFRKAGIRSAQVVRGIIDTHKVGPIDDIRFKFAPDRLRCHSTEAIEVPSDHKFFGATFRVARGTAKP